MHRLPTVGDVIKFDPYRNAEWIVCNVNKAIISLVNDATRDKMTVTVAEGEGRDDFVPLSSISLIDTIRAKRAEKLWEAV